MVMMMKKKLKLKKKKKMMMMMKLTAMMVVEGISDSKEDVEEDAAEEKGMHDDNGAEKAERCVVLLDQRGTHTTRAHPARVQSGKGGERRREDQ